MKINYTSDKFVKNCLIGIFCVGVLLRITIAFLLREQFWTMGNATEPFDNIARSILMGKGFSENFGVTPDLYFQPVYSIFLAFCYSVLGRSWFSVSLFQAILAGATGIFVYKISNILFNNRKVGLLACLMVTFYPYTLVHTGRIFDTTVFTFFLVLAILWLFIMQKTPSIKNQLLAGLFLGLTALTRATIITLVPFLVLWCLIIFKFNEGSLVK